MKSNEKRNAKPKRPAAPKPSPAVVRAAALELLRTWGRRGGKAGGIARWEGVSPEERSRLTRAAVQARWAKTKKRATSKKAPRSTRPAT